MILYNDKEKAILELMSKSVGVEYSIEDIAPLIYGSDRKEWPKNWYKMTLNTMRVLIYKTSGRATKVVKCSGLGTGAKARFALIRAAHEKGNSLLRASGV